MEGECVCVERWRDECACREVEEEGGGRIVCVGRGGGKRITSTVYVEGERVSGEDVRLWEWEKGGVCRHNVCVD